MKNKKLIVLAMAAGLCVLSSMTAFAGQWKQDNTGWWWQEDDGSYPVSTWKAINGKQYYFGADGYMLVNTTTPDGYTVNGDGAWTVNGVVQEKDYFTDPAVTVDVAAADGWYKLIKVTKDGAEQEFNSFNCRVSSFWDQGVFKVGFVDRGNAITECEWIEGNKWSVNWLGLDGSVLTFIDNKTIEVSGYTLKGSNPMDLSSYTRDNLMKYTFSKVSE